MERHPELTRQRLAKLQPVLQSKIYAEIRPLKKLLISPRVDRISYEAAQKLAYEPVEIGRQLGPLWATFWFKGKAAVPKEWKGRRVDLLFVTYSESTLWMNGKSVQGLNYEVGPNDSHHSQRPDAILTAKARGGEEIDFALEAACNRLFGAGHNPFKSVSPYVLERAEIGLFDELAWDLVHDFMVLRELEEEEKKDLDKAWAGTLLYELNRFANTYVAEDRSTWAAAGRILKALLKQPNAPFCHELSAIGHAHIDTAWLWPLAETYRKCVRTFSTAVRYMEEYPEYRFACSQAVQYKWMKERNPDLYARIRAKVKGKQFIPAGGTWVEPDCNIPSGEALVRQFLFGQRFFKQEFGIHCSEFWNPDVFGYNGQLPQILRLAGMTRFLTQKLSWNQFNRPHYHSFIWEGIDGSQVYTHFPPTDTYNAVATVPQLRENVRNYKDNDRSRCSYMLFGFGDGGGGPSRQMLERLRRCQDLLGVPRTTQHTPDEFFERFEADLTDWPRQIGELYFEYHRGTYTTQAAVKRGNRKCEWMMHDAEFLATLAWKAAGKSYPGAAINGLWETLLLNQFHDILPGSSITLVYEDAAKDHARILSEGAKVRGNAAAGLGKGAGVVNTIGFARAEVAQRPDGALAYVEAPSYGIGRETACPDEVTLKQQNGRGWVLENAHLRATLNRGGELVSLVEKQSGRETMASAGNQMLIYDDRPIAHDAWDVDPFHMETEKVCPVAHAASVAEKTPLRAAIRFERKISDKSSMVQVISLSAASRRLEFNTSIEWHEKDKMLKVGFPVSVKASDATYEMQFGCVQRPTHFNTRYDLARYEVPGHRWSDLSEPGFGVALLSESKYGFSTFGNTMRMSFLRAPKVPDPTADMGHHEFTYAIMPHRGDWREAGVVAEAMRFNVPLLFAGVKGEGKSYLWSDTPALVIDTVKKAEDSDAIIVRLYEAHGTRGEARIGCALPFKSAKLVNLLEEEIGEAATEASDILLPFEPFKILTLKLS